MPRPHIVLTSPLLDGEGFSHGFFTRHGGVSPAPWSSLNFAANTGDKFEHIRENLAIAGRSLGADGDRIYFLSQIHGTEVKVVEGDEDRTEMVLRQGDATVSIASEVVCGVRSADCATLLLADRRSGAVAAVHAGWRGTVRGVVESAVRSLIEIAGPKAELTAAIGPHIEVCCFEVGDDVAAELAGCSDAGERAVVRGSGRPRVDLRTILDAKLHALGIAQERIDHVRGCTVCDDDCFFSFRREGQVSGRMLSAIRVRDDARAEL